MPGEFTEGPFAGRKLRKGPIKSPALPDTKFSLLRGESNQSILVEQIPDGNPKKDPFRAIDQKTGQEVRLNEQERAEAHLYFFGSSRHQQEK